MRVLHQTNIKRSSCARLPELWPQQSHHVTRERFQLDLDVRAALEPFVLSIFFHQTGIHFGGKCSIIPPERPVIRWPVGDCGHTGTKGEMQWGCA